MFDTGLEPMTSGVGGRRLDDWATNLATQLDLVSYFLFFTRCDVICDLLQCRRMEKFNLFDK